MKLHLYMAIGALVVLVGCEQAPPPPAKADALAVSDPDAKAKQLLADFANAEDGKTWVQQNQFALSVFQSVKDPAVKAEYNAKIAPLVGTK